MVRAVAKTEDGLDEILEAVRAKGFAKAHDMDVDRAELDARLLPPQQPQKIGTREEVMRTLEKKTQERVFGGSERKPAAADVDFVGCIVDAEEPPLRPRRLRRGGLRAGGQPVLEDRTHRGVIAVHVDGGEPKSHPMRLRTQGAHDEDTLAASLESLPRRGGELDRRACVENDVGAAATRGIGGRKIFVRTFVD